MLNDEFKIGFFEGMWYKFERWFNDWIYPAYNIKNLFKRHDLVKLPHIKPWECSDISEKMLYANFELIKEFIEKEHPEKHICWYTDPETGEELGHKYGERENYVILYPELKDKWIMDIIKDIYNYYTVIYPLQTEKIEYLKHFHHEYLMGEMKDKPVENSEYYEVYWDKTKCIKTKEELYNLNLNWNILDSVGLCRSELLDEKLILKKIRELENEQFNDIQEMLHLIIEVRPYLWT